MKHSYRLGIVKSRSIVLGDASFLGNMQLKRHLALLGCGMPVVALSCRLGLEFDIQLIEFCGITKSCRLEYELVIVALPRRNSFESFSCELRSPDSMSHQAYL